MYSKDELSSKEASDLLAIAQEIGAEVSDKENQEAIIYAILDKQAEQEGQKNPLGAKRRRTRIVKKDTDKVYTVSGKDGENFDIKKNQNASDNSMSDSQKDDNTTKEETPESILAAMPKHRGRKSKKELELMAAAEAAKQQAAQANEAAQLNLWQEQDADSPVTEEVPQPMQDAEPDNTDNDASHDDFVPEAAFAASSAENNDEEKSNLIAQLQAKINAHNESADTAQNDYDDSVWAGDPGDGTDFISVIDLPIEDQGAVPNYDMFDNPTTPMAGQMQQAYQQPAAMGTADACKYDFTDIITANGVLEIMPDGYGFLRSSDYN